LPALLTLLLSAFIILPELRGCVVRSWSSPHPHPQTTD
jgi:hypothetical protein